MILENIYLQIVNKTVKYFFNLIQRCRNQIEQNFFEHEPLIHIGPTIGQLLKAHHHQY